MHVSGPTLGELVLLGGGHAQVEVLKQFAMAPVPGLRLTLVTPDVRTPYSGMLPGFVEGVCSDADLHIDLSRLAQMANARLIIDQVTGIDADNNFLHFASRPPLFFDMLSINIGGQPNLAAISGAKKHAIPVKPISLFQNRLQALLDGNQGIANIAVIGGGAAGCELALSLSKRWLNQTGKRPKMALFSRSKRLLPYGNATAARLIAADLGAIGCALHLGQEVAQIKKGSLRLAGGMGSDSDHAFDVCFLVSAVTPPDWLAACGLSLDDRGFIAVGPTLQSKSHPHIFASGDIASLSPEARPKAGVFAVRAGPWLATNLRQYALGGRMREWRPQTRYLALLGTGDGKAIAMRGNYASKSRLWWHLKVWIDRRWMAKYTDLSMERPKLPLRLIGINGRKDKEPQFGNDPAFAAMRCLGCGAKTGHETLSQALQEARKIALEAGANPEMMPAPGLSEDSAILPIPTDAGPDAEMVQSVDMISQIVSDPYRLGKIAAVHALSDLYAANADPKYALAIINLPEARIDLQQQQLTQILAGSLAMLADAGARLVGGHTSEGEIMSVGFSATGWRRKAPAPLDSDDENLLVLSKPLGIGLIMAAQMELCADGASFAAAIDSMEASNAPAADIFNKSANGAAWMTDVTGFGLARHAVNLVERAGFSGLQINLTAVPLIIGAKDILATDIRSSLDPQNRAAVRFDDSNLSAVWRRRADILFDPQTSGGLLTILPAKQAQAVVDTSEAKIIGRITPQKRGLELIAEEVS